MMTSRWDHSATLLTDGRVLVSGGANDGLHIPAGATAEVFDPAAVAPKPSITEVSPSGGPSRGGTRVVIKGAGLAGAGPPRFGGVAASYYRIESPTTIVATAPPHEAGRVAVVVEGPGGTSALATSVINDFTYGTWTPTASMVTARRMHATSLISDGSVLVSGGRTGSGVGGDLSSVERYQPLTGRWEKSSGLSEARAEHSSTVLGGSPCSASPPPDWCGKVVIAGGVGATGRTLDTAEIYDPGPGTWSAGPLMNRPRAGHVALGLRDGAVLVVGGTDPTGDPALAQRYFPGDTPGWEPAGRLGTARVGHAALLLADGSLLVVGGSDLSGRSLASVERFDPAAAPEQAWSQIEPMAAPRSGLSATLLADGRVLVAGGGTDTAEIYDPKAVSAADKWSETGSLSSARTGHEGVLLSSRPCAERCDKVLVAGGSDSAGTPVASAELFDPSTGKWTPTEVFVEARSQHTLTPLGDGSVLAAGGAPPVAGFNPPRELATAEVYLPAKRPPRIGAIEPPGGPTLGGTTVRIVGNGLFDPATQVRFGEDGASPAAALLFVSDTEVIAVSPPQPQGTVRVVVRTQRGESPASRQARFTYAPGNWSPTTSRPVSSESVNDPALAFGHTATLLDGEVCRGPSPRPWCGKVLVAGGQSGTEGASSAFIYDPATAKWSPTAPMSSISGAALTATALDGPTCRGASPPAWCGRVLVVRANRAEMYDPEASSWTPTGALQVPRFWHSATLLSDGRVLVTGGSSNPVAIGGEVMAAEVYDPGTGVWSRTGDLAVGRALHSATLLPGGKVFVVGGLGKRPGDNSNGPTLTSTELWDPAVTGQFVAVEGHQAQGDTSRVGQVVAAAPGAFASADELAEGRFAHTATLLAGKGCAMAGAPSWCGTVLVVGGSVSRERGDFFSPLVYLRSAELYDSTAPPGKRWSSAGVLNQTRAGHSTTQVGDGRVLVAGRGTPILDQTGAPPLATAEVYDPVTRGWSYTGSMQAARGLHSATLLSGPECGRSPPPAWCGSVLAVGGSQEANRPSNGNPGLATAEIYTPTPTLTKLTPSQGPPGTEVVIEGTGFSATAVPTFGDVSLAPGSFRVDSPTRITATAPSHPGGSVDVAVVNPSGSSATMAPNPATRFKFFGLAGAVDDLVAKVVSDTEVSLSFSAPADAAGRPATRYVMKVSSGSIDTDEAFDAARTICVPSCRPDPGPGQAGDSVVFSVAGLRPGTDYAFSLRPLTEAGPGPRSNTALAHTTGIARKICAAIPDPGVNQVAYPEGYSLVGGPSSTRLMANGPLYSWFDQGARGAYATSAADEAIAEGRGYWAWFSCPALVTLAGPGPDQIEMPLGAYHASMVANPSSSAQATLTGHDFAAAWDPDANDGAGGYHISGYRAAQNLAVGEGTWAFSYVPTTLRLAAQR